MLCLHGDATRPNVLTAKGTNGHDGSEVQRASLAVVLVTEQGPHLVDFLFHEDENSIAPVFCWRGVM